jgi:hypothetical protein
MRARMFMDDLSRVVDEIENSAVMWYGISASAHGYDAIDTEEQVTVRSEVARLTRLYDKAVKTNTMNDPDMYNGGSGADSYSAGLKKTPGGGVVQPLPGQQPAPDNHGIVSQPPAAAALPPAADPDASPASKAITSPRPEADNKSDDAPADSPESTTKPTKDTKNDKSNEDKTTTTPDADKPAPNNTSSQDQGNETAASASTSSARPASTPNPVMDHEHDPDESPASAARLHKKEDA